MTAFKHWQPCCDFTKGKGSCMLRMRLHFTRALTHLRRRTLVAPNAQDTPMLE